MHNVAISLHKVLLRNGCEAAGILVPSLMVLFNAITAVGKWTRDELSRVQAPPYCGPD